ncbi:agmatine hydroxycinnamoyltransferase 1-like [Euphorbia lathyris]|uniref:agmatine hydroxycinnamoyltransferase 1-like n=1 Tax=Euphorbia lathyris TaxID=212925 RepID=UPI0033134890
MKVRIDSIRTIKPIYKGITPSTLQSIPLSVFDKATYNAQIAIIYAYRSPTPPNEAIEFGLQRALSEYRELAGRLRENEKGDLHILLNDKGVKFVEATVDSTLDEVMPLEPSSALLNLHPSLKDVEEIIQVQLTRFTCGSLVVGSTCHHLVADANATSNFLVAWGSASRGLDIDPLPILDRTIFSPRNPPDFKFEHKGVEFKSKTSIKDHLNYIDYPININVDDIIVHKVHFTLDFISKLKAKASVLLENKSYSTFESLVAHLWRTITMARGLGGFEKTHVKISVNGRMRMDPKIPNEYFGNLVLWAFPTARVKDLVQKPVSYATKLIHDAIVNMNDSYFKSFIDFATHKENLVPTAEMNKSVLCPNLEVDSWLRFPFYDVGFGEGSPVLFMPSYFPTEGMVFLLPSSFGDKSINAFVPLFYDNLDVFKQIIYSLN